MATPHPLIERLVEVCAQRGLYDWIIAPGSRSAPLTVALSNHPAMRCRLVFDERSAGYIALGLAQQRRQAVGLVCTSGTAAVNFGPAAVEAFYQGIPLLVLTADRPPEWIDQQDNQAIRQADLYGRHVRAAFTFPLDDGAGDTAWHAERVVANAIDIAVGWEPGPVHINVPLREPLYGSAAQLAEPRPTRPTLHMLPAQPRLDEPAWPALLASWQSAQRKLIVAGLHPADTTLRQSLAALAADPTVSIFADVTANLHGLEHAPAQADSALATHDATARAALEPDLVVAFGGQVTSKALKTLLRARPPQALWHLYPGRVAPDTYQALTHALPMQPAAFFAELAARAPAAGAGGYRATWRAQSDVARTVVAEFVAAAPFGELAAVDQVLAALPAGSRLQVGNSMPIRYVNLLGLKPGHLPAQVNGNRGTSGIDGTVSTAVGAAMADSTLTTLLVGDLGFFYDRNGLWHRHLPPNLRIVVFNNHGGGIFDIIDGPNKLPRPQQSTWFLTPQPLRAERTAADHGLRYFFAASGPELTAALPAFFAAADTPALLEIETDLELNSRIFAQLRTVLAQQPAARP